MPNLDKFKEKVKEYDGEVILWIDQASDSRVKSKSIAGVCFALAREYAWASQEGGVRLSGFLNEFKSQEVDDSTEHIPQKYIVLQNTYAAQNTLYKKSIASIKKAIAVAIGENKEKLEQTLEELRSGKQQAFYGESFSKIVIGSFKIVGELPTDILFEAIKKVQREYPDFYVMVNMFGDGPSHGIAFGYRPGLLGTEFKYQYLDANFGLTSFKNKDDMTDFFFNIPWYNFYNKKNYKNFELVFFMPVVG